MFKSISACLAGLLERFKAVIWWTIHKKTTKTCNPPLANETTVWTKGYSVSWASWSPEDKPNFQYDLSQSKIYNYANLKIFIERKIKTGSDNLYIVHCNIRLIVKLVLSTEYVSCIHTSLTKPCLGLLVAHNQSWSASRDNQENDETAPNS